MVRRSFLANFFRHRFSEGEENAWKVWECGKLAFVDEVMRFRAGEGFAFLASRFEVGAGRSDFDVEAVVADEGDHFAIGVEDEFAEHSFGGEAVRVAEFA